MASFIEFLTKKEGMKMKQNTSKRILSLLMTLVMILGIFATAIPAAATGSAYVYSINQLKDNPEIQHHRCLCVYL